MGNIQNQLLIFVLQFWLSIVYTHTEKKFYILKENFIKVYMYVKLKRHNSYPLLTEATAII